MKTASKTTASTAIYILTNNGEPTKNSDLIAAFLSDNAVLETTPADAVLLITETDSVAA